MAYKSEAIVTVNDLFQIDSSCLFLYFISWKKICKVYSLFDWPKVLIRWLYSLLSYCVYWRLEELVLQSGAYKYLDKSIFLLVHFTSTHSKLIDCAFDMIISGCINVLHISHLKKWTLLISWIMCKCCILTVFLGTIFRNIILGSNALVARPWMTRRFSKW